MKVQETQSLELQNKFTETTKQLEKEQGARKEFEILTSVTFFFFFFFLLKTIHKKKLHTALLLQKRMTKITYNTPFYKLGYVIYNTGVNGKGKKIN